jgi:dihydroorotate dehydrogenase electron transfer subunit
MVRAPITGKQKLPRGNFLLSLEAPEIARISRPGQFVMISPLSDQELPNPLLKRALAIYSIGTTGHSSEIRFVIKEVGDGTRRLANLAPGETADLVGPLGNGFDLDRAKGKSNLLIAGGTGIASVFMLAKALLDSSEKVHLIYGGRTLDDLAGLSDFEKLGMPVTVTTEDGSRGIQGLVTEGLRQFIDKHNSSNLNLYTCGPNPMMEAVTSIALEENVSCQISIESKMACGFGVCLGCSVKTNQGYRLSCTDGPVFSAEEFIWESATRPSPLNNAPRYPVQNG